LKAVKKNYINVVPFVLIFGGRCICDRSASDMSLSDPKSKCSLSEPKSMSSLSDPKSTTSRAARGCTEENIGLVEVDAGSGKKRRGVGSCDIVMSL
jgi:hypothetical protein